MTARPGPPAADLAALQRAFHDAVTGAAPLARARGLVRDDGIDPIARLRVYANAYFARLHAALVADYPKLHALAGDDVFRSWVVPYLRAFPTRDPSLREAGVHLPRFLETHARAWADLARLERARVEAFDGADAPPLSRADLARLPPEAFPHLRLRVVPAAALVAMTTNADELWDALEEDRVAPPVVDTAREVLVWRRALVVVHRTLEIDEHAPLRLLAAGATFAEICERVQEVRRALALLVRWLDAGVLVGDPAVAGPSDRALQDR